jgi:hypothetical protein
MTPFARFTLTAYAAALRLYPAAFRAKYSDQMLDAARASCAESRHRMRFALALAADTAGSLLREHWRAAAPASPGYAAAFAIFFSFALVTVSVVYQQVLRRGADQLPLKLVAYTSDRLAHGADPARFIGGPHREISSPDFLKSNQFIVILFNPAGQLIVGNATLHGALPQPPLGIFRHASLHGLYKVTWQPDRGIRVALTIQPLLNGDFIVAGQSLIPSETREAASNNILRWIWLTMLAATAALVLLTRPAPRPPRPSGSRGRKPTTCNRPIATSPTAPQSPAPPQ